MSAPGVRQRGGQTSKKQSTATPQPRSDEVIESLRQTVTSQWDYKAALTVITVLAFITRFWGIGHPNEVVFDEVHFGKVRDPRPMYRVISIPPLVEGSSQGMTIF